ncbi:hypothetical protein AWJ20_2908 [Sugiyamaella lignohabitans]|uniref:Clg1p n=1 Tax=Sugiyamaella lignohabitans TaxID=796027 RepID=A0A167FGV5_9ASCO|nr:uncharacterized protein AWJ20_2908 [Sugiyamaella lignohabitans]ANB15282.1 hypothetical protein AWJ20_2908 [Sugiyamaella lignohabitans]
MVLYHSPPRAFEGFPQMYEEGVINPTLGYHKDDYRQHNPHSLLPPTSYYPSPAGKSAVSGVSTGMIPDTYAAAAAPVHGPVTTSALPMPVLPSVPSIVSSAGISNAAVTATAPVSASSISGSASSIGSGSSDGSVTSASSYGASSTAASNPTSSATANSTCSSSPAKKNKSIYYNNVANIVCLLWFNDINLLMKCLNEAQVSNSYANCKTCEFSSHSIPTSAFKQFIANVITRTQLPPTAVSLALLYILRLKRYAPVSIVGSANSEYRVFSVALILTNKYLDDNTYTNKTWADITRLPLKELSAMEIEFLGNMRYSLHVDQAEWRAWQRQLKVWLNIHYWVSDNVNNAAAAAAAAAVAAAASNFNNANSCGMAAAAAASAISTANNNANAFTKGSPGFLGTKAHSSNNGIAASASASTSPVTGLPTPKSSNLTYLSLVSPPLRGVINGPSLPSSVSQFQLHESYAPNTHQHQSYQPSPTRAGAGVVSRYVPSPVAVAPNVHTTSSALPTPPLLMPNGTAPMSSRKRMYMDDVQTSSSHEYPSVKRQAVVNGNGFSSYTTHQPPAFRTLINSNMPSFNPSSQTNTPQPPKPLQSAPIYYVISQRKTFSPHYGYPQSNYLLPQQYQFELQHYTPHHQVPSPMATGSQFRPVVQFLSPTTASSSSASSYWRTPTANYNRYQQQFSSPPPNY